MQKSIYLVYNYEDTYKYINKKGEYMKGVKRRFANVRNIALFISIFMFISLFSNITVIADELENGEVNPVVSEQAELQSNEEFDTENELLIPEETTDYDDAQNDEVTSADLTGSGEELSEESKEELPTAEEANKQEEFFQEEILVFLVHFYLLKHQR